jgi:hypothetical protein
MSPENTHQMKQGIGRRFLKAICKDIKGRNLEYWKCTAAIIKN